MKFLYLLLCSIFLLPLTVIGQENGEGEIQTLDNLYREDQFYLGFTYNILTSTPSGVVSSGFSGGLQAGFIRDFPLNERRNIAVGIGLGWSWNSYGQTLFIGEEPGNNATTFEVIDDRLIDYDRNRFSIQVVEVPLQFRWRTSTAESHKFWRIYTGLRLGYAFHFQSTFIQPGNEVRQTKVPEFDRFRLGATADFGYNTFNFHFYYGLNPFFGEEAKVNGEVIGMSSIQIGLMFYIL